MPIPGFSFPSFLWLKEWIERTAFSNYYYSIEFIDNVFYLFIYIYFAFFLPLIFSHAGLLNSLWFCPLYSISRLRFESRNVKLFFFFFIGISPQLLLIGKTHNLILWCIYYTRLWFISLTNPHHKTVAALVPKLKLTRSITIKIWLSDLNIVKLFQLYFESNFNIDTLSNLII